MFKITSVVFAVATVAAAQLDGFGLSQSCTTTILTVAGNPDASSCLDVGGLLSIATTPANTSYIPKIDAWIGGVCSAAPCQAATLTSLGNNISTGCATDLKPYIDTSTVNLSQYITQYYPTIREILCLKDGANGGAYCVTEDLTAVQTAVGTPLSLTGLLGVITGSLSFNASAIPKAVVCGSCSQAAYSIFKTEQPALFSNASVEADVVQECGQAFVSGGVPSSISQGASSAAATTSTAGKSGAAVALMPASAMQWLGLAATSSVAGIMVLLM